MREIKFRAWDKEDKLFYYFDLWTVHQEYIDNGNQLANNKRPVEQYTGLKDKNDKEIYEGDIIRYMDGKNMVVQWSSTGYIGWELYRKKKMGKNIHHLKYMYYDHSKCPNAAEEVIGSIHENPELLI